MAGGAMERRRVWSKKRVVLLALFVSILGALAWLLVPAPDPMFRGKPESFWIARLSDGKWSMADRQVEKWRALGPDGVQVLIRALDNADCPLERTYRKAYAKIGSVLPGSLMGLLPVPENDSTCLTRQCVTDLLWRLGKDAKIAIPVMARALKDENPVVRQHAIYFFTAGGVGGHDALLNQMDKKDRRKLLPDFIRSMQEGDSLNDSAAIALGYFPEQREVVAPALVNVMFEWGLQAVPLDDWANAIPEMGAMASRVYVAARDSLKRIAPDAQWAKERLKQRIDCEALAKRGVQQ